MKFHNQFKQEVAKLFLDLAKLLTAGVVIKLVLQKQFLDDLTLLAVVSIIIVFLVILGLYVFYKLK